LAYDTEILGILPGSRTARGSPGVNLIVDDWLPDVPDPMAQEQL
jgi:hypothetical protein